MPFGEMHAEIGHASAASNHSCLKTDFIQIICTPKYWDQPYTPGKAHHFYCWLYMPKYACFRYTWIWVQILLRNVEAMGQGQHPK